MLVLLVVKFVTHKRNPNKKVLVFFCHQHKRKIIGSILSIIAPFHDDLELLPSLMT